MSGAELAQIITSVATLVGAIAGLMVSLRNSKKIEQVHQSTDGKMDALIEEVRRASFAQGVKAEKEKSI
jgi:uncharacterized membrane protein